MRLGSVCVAALICAASAGASPLNPAALMASYNLITSGEAGSNQDIEGAVIVGGNFTNVGGPNQLFNNTGRLPANKTSYVFGDNIGQVHVDNGGSLYVGGNNYGSINLNGGGNKLQVGGTNFGTIQASGGGAISVVGGNLGGTINGNGSTVDSSSSTIVPPISLAAVVTALNSYSNSLAGLTSNGSITAVPNSLALSYAGTGQAVFDLTASQFTSYIGGGTTLSFVLADPSSPVVVNVDLQNADWTAPSNLHLGGTALQNVLFNFYDGAGTLLTFDTQWEASILAMGSTVTNSTPIEGSLAAAHFYGYGELHNYPLETPPHGSSNTPVPEPASLTLLAAGLAGAFGRKRKKKAV